MKLISLLIPIITVLLSFSGCGDEDTQNACIYSVQQNLDQGNYDLVISTLENNETCQGAFTSDDAWLNLAAAYMGKSGLTMSNLLGAVVDSNSSSAMSSFMTSFAASATSEGLSNLNKASTIYSYIGTSVCDGTEKGSKAEACLYDGLVTLTEAVGSLSAILGSDTLAILSGDTALDTTTNDLDNDGTADELQITACALAYGQTPNADPGLACDENITMSAGTLKTIDTIQYHVGDFTMLTGNPVYKLFTDANPGLLLTTDGACDANRTSCSIIDGTTCFPCPVIVNGNTTTVTSGLLSIINSGGLDSLSNFLPSDSNGTDSNITAELIQSITNDANATSVTEEQLATFLQNL